MKQKTATPEGTTVSDRNKDKIKELTFKISVWLFLLIEIILMVWN